VLAGFKLNTYKTIHHCPMCAKAFESKTISFLGKRITQAAHQLLFSHMRDEHDIRINFACHARCTGLMNVG
jgi:hypothetical protein